MSKTSDKAFPWECYPSIWKTKAAFMAWLRGGIRRGLWEKSPIKLEFIKKNRIQIPNPNPRGNKPTVWGAQCALTGEYHVLSNIQVDHKQGENRLRDITDIQSFIENIVLVCDDDLQLVSKEAHKCKNIADKRGITFEEAIVEKKVIEFGKLSVNEQKKCLQSLYDAATIKSLSNAAKRAEAYKQHLLKERVDE